jgi:hypothetical protein
MRARIPALPAWSRTRMNPAIAVSLCLCGQPFLISRYNLISTLHERQCVRRFALSVPQEAQRLYIVRANQFVTTALAASIRTRTSMLRSVLLNVYASLLPTLASLDFNSCASLQALRGSVGRVRSRGGTRPLRTRRRSTREVARHPRRMNARAPKDVAQPQNLDGRPAPRR